MAQAGTAVVALRKTSVSSFSLPDSHLPSRRMFQRPAKVSILTSARMAAGMTSRARRPTIPHPAG
jgi:hypothetical protein